MVVGGGGVGRTADSSNGGRGPIYECLNGSPLGLDDNTVVIFTLDAVGIPKHGAT